MKDKQFQITWRDDKGKMIVLFGYFNLRAEPKDKDGSLIDLFKGKQYVGSISVFQAESFHIHEVGKHTK